MSYQCCIDGSNLYVDGSYVCSKCGKDRTKEHLNSIGYDFHTDFKNFINSEVDKKCDCGAAKTSNPDCHAYYCSIKK